jgi:hypothetical protein
VTPALLLSIGSRSGSLAALLFFAVIFGGLAAIIARRLRRARPGRLPGGMMPAIAGWTIFLLPVTLIYVTSLDGFYDAHLTPDGVRLRYFVPMITADVGWQDVRQVEAVPQYRGTWRLRIVTGGGTFESAVARRDVVEHARASLTPDARR